MGFLRPPEDGPFLSVQRHHLHHVSPAGKHEPRPGNSETADPQFLDPSHGPDGRQRPADLHRADGPDLGPLPDLDEKRLGHVSGAVYSYRNAWGVANDQVGIWHLAPSMEWSNGGPTKVKGAVSGNYLYMNSTDGHCLGGGVDNPGVAAGQVFTKICGPFFTYVNTGTNHMALWQDAQTRRQQEVAAWPYAWVNESEADYPRQRGASSAH